MLIKDLERMLWETYSDWSHLLVNPRIDRSQSTLSWQEYESTFLPHFVSNEDLELLAEMGQYTFQVIEDGALFQFYYGFADQGRTIREAKLAFYGPLGNVWVDDDLAEEVEPKEELLADVTPVDEDPVTTPRPKGRSTQSSFTGPAPAYDHYVSWMRLDYQPSQARGLLHSCCHLHLSGFPEARILVKGLPTPSQFVEFVVHLKYPKVFSEHRLGADGFYRDRQGARERQKPVLAMDEDLAVPWLTHFRVAGA